MCIHSPSVGAVPPNTPRSLPVVLCGLGHCCTGPSDLLGSALGEVWFTWQRTEQATTLVVLDSNDAASLRSLVRAVNSCAHKDRIRVRTRSIDDRAHALTVISSLPTGRVLVREPAGHPARGFRSQLTIGTDASGTAARGQH